MSSNLQGSASVWQKICSADPHTAACVYARLVSLSPDGSEDDVCWVWHHLASHFPDVADYDYSDRQIRWAWRCVRQARRRQDTLGCGRQRGEAGRRRQRAMARLAHELNCPLARLPPFDLNDYHPAAGTLAIGTDSVELLVRLSPSTKRAIDNWLKLRGWQPGGVFSLPELPEFREEPLAGRDEAVGGCAQTNRGYWGDDPASRAEQEDAIEQHCAGKGELACAFVLKNMCDQGGDWSAELLDRLLRRCGTLAGHGFTKSERRTCLKKLHAAVG